MHGQPSRAARLAAPRHARHRGRDRAPPSPRRQHLHQHDEGKRQRQTRERLDAEAEAKASLAMLRAAITTIARTFGAARRASVGPISPLSHRAARAAAACVHGLCGGPGGGPGGGAGWGGRVGGRSGGACRSRRLGRHPPWRGPCTAEVRFAAARRQGLFQNQSRRATPGAWDGVRSAPSPGPSPAPSPTPDRCSATAGPCRRCATAFAACAALMSFSIIRA